VGAVSGHGLSSFESPAPRSIPYRHTVRLKGRTPTNSLLDKNWGQRHYCSTWIGKVAFLVRSVHARLFERLKAPTKLFADETTASVLDPGRGRTKTGQLFAYVRNECPMGRRRTAGRRPSLRARPQGRAGGPKPPRLRRHAAGRWLRRLQGPCRPQCCEPGVLRSLAQGGPALIATEAFTRTAELYRIKGEIRGRSAEERRHPRQARSSAIVDALKHRLKAQLALINQKSKLTEAIRYTFSR
jgi:hypothetical protein